MEDMVTMKMKDNDYATMRQAVTDMPPNPTERERWDALWRAVDSGRLSWDILHGYQDAHIDTALRAIGHHVAIMAMIDAR